MPSVLNIDFETRSAAPLPKVGAHVYARHPTTDILCAAYVFDDGPVQLWLPGQPFPDDIRAHVESGGAIHAYNCAFERLIWWHVAEPKYGWSHAELEQFWDTAAAGAACALPRPLGDAAAALGGEHQKDSLGYSIMMRLSKPRSFTEDGQPVWYEDPVKFEHLCRYCEKDTIVERAIAKRIPKLGAAEREVFLLDQRINERGVLIDVELAKAAYAMAEKETAAYERKLRVITNGAVTKPTQVARMKTWLAEQGVELESLNAKSLASYDMSSLPPDAQEALTNRLEAAKSSLGKLQAMQMVAGHDNRARGLLLFNGASTGRWSGKLIQPQNFPRGIKLPKGWEDYVLPMIMAGDAESIQALFGPVLDVLSTSLRAMIMAAPGHRIMAADFSAVEARGVAWLAGCESLVRQFKNNEDVYCVAAEGIFNRSIDPNVDEFERFLGKQTVLGSGYGMGPKRFVEQCATYGITVPLEMAEKSIGWYREAYSEIPKLWREVEKAAIEAVRSPGVITEAAGGKLKFRVKGDFAWLVLPSGRPLAYYDPKLEDTVTPWGAPASKLSFMGVNPKTKKWQRQSTWGGTLVENATQAMCRDLMVNAMFGLEKANFPVILTVHDEVICEVPIGHGSVKEFEAIVKAVPDWASTFPLDAKGWEGPRYRKG